MRSSNPNPNSIGLEFLCRMMFQGDRAIEECTALLEEIARQGYANIPKKGMRWYVYRRMVEIGVIKVTEIPHCRLNKMKRSIVLNVQLVYSIYNVLQSLKAPPICLE